MDRKIVRFPDQRSMRDEAAAWLIKLDGDEPLTAEQRSDLAEWLQQSVAHREEIKRLAIRWGKLNVATDLAVPLGRSPSPGQDNAAAGTRRTNWLWRGVAASVSVGTVAVILATVAFQRPDGVANGTFDTAIGEQQTIELADGSVAMLNTNSRIKIDYSDEVRTIVLHRGEAHFTVRQDPHRPLRVFAGTSRIQAIGTAFAVRLRSNSEVSVTVTKGTVEVAKRALPSSPDLAGASRPGAVGAGVGASWSAPIGVLQAGETMVVPDVLEPGRVASGPSPVQLMTPELMDRRMSWRRGVLQFSGESLGQVVAEIGRYTTVVIEFADPTLRELPIGGRFPVGEIDTLMDVLESQFGLQATRVGPNRVRLSGPGESSESEPGH